MVGKQLKGALAVVFAREIGALGKNLWELQAGRSLVSLCRRSLKEPSEILKSKAENGRKLIGTTYEREIYSREPSVIQLKSCRTELSKMLAVSERVAIGARHYPR